MYILLTQKHPLYESQDTLESYAKKLESSDFKFTDAFSEYF